MWESTMKIGRNTLFLVGEETLVRKIADYFIGHSDSGHTRWRQPSQHHAKFAAKNKWLRKDNSRKGRGKQQVVVIVKDAEISPTNTHVVRFGGIAVERRLQGDCPWLA